MIEIFEVVKNKDISRFRRRQIKYFKKDIFTDHRDKDYAYFVSKGYWKDVLKLHEWSKNSIQFVFFVENGKEIGECQFRLNDAKDYSLLIMEFFVYKKYRGNGKGHECAMTFMDFANKLGARYFELNADDERRRKFWSSLGFYENGIDAYNNPLMINTLDGIVKFLNNNEKNKYIKLLNQIGDNYPEQKINEAYVNSINLVNMLIKNNQIVCYMDKGQILGILTFSRRKNSIDYLCAISIERQEYIIEKMLEFVFLWLDKSKAVNVGGGNIEQTKLKSLIDKTISLSV